MKAVGIITAALSFLMLTAFTGSLGVENEPIITTVVKSGKIGLEVGDTAPDVEMSSPDGKVYKLSSLRGKVVFVDFWASWCGYCRRENPNVVNAYNKYSKAKFKDAKGFEIYSVSFDTDPDRWNAAIAQDNLGWKYHVSDLKGWSSQAVSIYNVRGIPASFLLDKDGVILAKNLKGMNLHKALDELVKSF